MGSNQLGFEFPDEREDLTWVTGQLPYRGGVYKYTVIIWGPNDPPRSDRPKRGGRSDNMPHLTIKKTPIEVIRRQLLEHLDDGIARTLNRIAVEIWDLESSIVWRTKVETALWNLVEERLVEFTMEAPVLFRRIRDGISDEVEGREAGGSGEGDRGDEEDEADHRSPG